LLKYVLAVFKSNAFSYTYNVPVDCTVCTAALYFGSRSFGILKSIFFQKPIFPATSSMETWVGRESVNKEIDSRLVDMTKIMGKND
jgi:hypothetical protein